MKNPTQTSNNSESSIKLTEQSEASPRAYSSRHLLDAFGDSLIYVNSLYNKEFGYSARKVPAHMPHMMNADVITEMQARWPEQWDLTSSHRFRDSRDMQFAFSYYYFLMSEVSEFNLTRLWETLDLDRDGVLGKGEFRNMAVNLLSPPLLKNGADILYHKIANCTYDINITEVPVFQNITLETLQTCNRTIDMLEDAYWGLKYKFRLSNLDDVAFIMVNTNDTSLQKRLDSIREKSNKFICLNDNMNHSHPAAQHTIQVLQNFYQSLFPLPSQYELPPGRRNRFLHMDELRRAQKIVAAKNLYIIVASGIFIFVMLSVACCCVCSSTTSPSKRKMAKRMKNLLEP
ncbi:N-acetylglucosamine-1-phosphotransferase subunits alpha/beta [Pelomyxa schiedti]|nr:N-acetylglucosamine-1-phosphotransferase subunits alpha/beta [Pelomyxa schiedti]